MSETFKKIFIKDNIEIEQIDKNFDLFSNIEEISKSSKKIFIQEVSSKKSFEILNEKLKKEKTFSLDVNKDNILSICWTENSIYSIDINQGESNKFIKLIQPLFNTNSRIFVFDLNKILGFFKK